MLALTRKKDEAIIINDNIEIKILDVVGDKVKIGISAPREIDIYRKEIYLQVQESNTKATTGSADILEHIKNMMK